MGRVVDLKTTRVWVLTAVADPTLALVTTAELTAGKDITLQLLPSSKIPSYDSDKTTSEYNIAQGDEIIAPIGSSYSGSFDLFRDFTAGAPSLTDLLVTTFMGNYEQFFVVVREGYAVTLAPIAAQKVAIYQVIAGKPQRKRGSNSGFIKATVPLYTLGNANEYAAIS